MSDSTIPALPAGTTPIGTEPVASVQGGVDVRFTTKQLGDAGKSSTIYVVAPAVNFNAGNTDTPIAIVLPAGVTNFMVSAVILANASAAINTATAGLFTAAAGGGVAIVTGGSAITVSTAAANTNNNSQAMTINNGGTQSYNVGTLYFRVGTAQGSAATADVIIHIRPLP